MPVPSVHHERYHTPAPVPAHAVDPGMSQSTLLRQRRFLPLFLTQFLGAFNDNVFKNALVVYIAFAVAERTGRDSSLLVILAAGIFILPFFLFSATAGQLADKYEKSLLIRRIKLAEILIMLLGALGFYYRNEWALMGVLFLMGAQSTLFGPIKYGILPQHLDTDSLLGGNGLIQMGTFLAILLGTIVGGAVVAIESLGTELVGLITVSVALAGWLSSRFIPAAAAADAGHRMRWNPVRQTLKIMAYARRDHSVFVAILAISWFWFVGATFLSLVPSYAKNVLHGNEYVVTLLLAAFSVGIGCGSLLCERLSRGRIEPGLVPVGALGITLFGIDLFLAGSPVPASAYAQGLATAGSFLRHTGNWRVLADLTLLGAFGGLFIVPLYALVQQRSALACRSRIIAANNVFNALFMVFSALLTMALFALGLSIPGIFLLVALLNIVAALAVFRAVPEFHRRARRWLGLRGGDD